MGAFSSIEKIVSERTPNIRKLLLDPDRTAIININTSEGIFRKGELWSSHFTSAIPQLVRVNEYLLHCRKVFAVDYHSYKSTELKIFPAHCTEDSECQLLAELDSLANGAEIVVKNCSNAMFASGFLQWFARNVDTLDNFILAGAFTDVDVMQLALSLKSYFNEQDRTAKIIVVLNACRTFSAASHNAEDFHTFAAYNMLINGINCVDI